MRIRHHAQATTGWSWKSGSMANSAGIPAIPSDGEQQPFCTFGPATRGRMATSKASREGTKNSCETSRASTSRRFTGLYLDTQSNQSSDALEVNDTTTFSGSPHETGKFLVGKPLKMSRAAASKVACILTSIARQSGDSVMDSQIKSLAKGLPWNGLLILMRPAILTRSSKQKRVNVYGGSCYGS